MRSMTFLAVTALAFATPALAQTCQLDKSNNKMLVGDTVTNPGEAFPAPVVADALVNVMFANEKVRQALGSCTPQAVRDELVRLNGWNASMMLKRDVTFVYPVPVQKEAAVATPAAPAAPPPPVVAAPTPQVAAPAAKPAPAPVVTAPRPPVVRPLPPVVRAADIWGAIAKLRAEDTKLRAKLATVPTNQLTGEQQALLAELSQIENLAQKLKDLPKEGPVATEILRPEQKVAVQQVLATTSTVEKYLGREATDWAAVLGFLGVILLGIYVIWFLRGRVNANGEKIEGALNRLIVVEEKVENVIDQVAADHVSIPQADLDSILNLAVGDRLTVAVHVNGQFSFRMHFLKQTVGFICLDPVRDYTGSQVGDILRFVRKAYRDDRLDDVKVGLMMAA